MDIKNIVEQLKSDEGFSGISYIDNSQYSWGFGTKAPGPGCRITEGQAEIDLWQRVALAIRDYYLLFKTTVTDINDVRQEALVNMLYNLGITKMAKFRNMLAGIDAGSWETVASEAMDSIWFRQVPKRAQRIVNELRTGKKEN
jgi:lysozyme